MIQVYNIHKDPGNIEMLRRATEENGGYGFHPVPYLIGTEEWWDAVNAGEVPRKVVNGMVSSVCWGAMGDYPSFTVTGDGDSCTSRRFGDVTRYVIGLKARVTLLRMKARHPDAKDSIVESILLEDSPRRTERRRPGPEGVLSRGSTQALEVEPRFTP